MLLCVAVWGCSVFIEEMEEYLWAKGGRDSIIAKWRAYVRRRFHEPNGFLAVSDAACQRLHVHLHLPLRCGGEHDSPRMYCAARIKE